MFRTATNLFAVLLLTCCCVSAAHATRYPRGPSNNCIDSLLVINIQDVGQACHPSSLSDTVFGLGGVVTGFDNKPTGFGFYIQNNRTGANGSPYTGIDVFTHGTNMASALGLGLGDSVVVEFGSVTEFNSGTEVLSPNNSFGTPDLIVRKVAGPSAAHPIPPFHVGTTAELQELPTNPNGELWEGCLVRINGPLRVARTDNIGGGANAFLAVDDILCGGGPCDTIYVDGTTLTTYAAPPLGTKIDMVQGIYEQRTFATPYPAGSYRIQLRDGNDVTVATPPNMTDAFPVFDNHPPVLAAAARTPRSFVGPTDSVMVVFDRAVELTSSQTTANYSTATFATVMSATRLSGSDNNKVMLALNSSLGDGDAETITVNGVKGLANNLPITSPQSRPFFNGVLKISQIQAPNPADLGASPCADRSKFAGLGSLAGDRLTFRGVVTKGFGNLYYLQDGSGTRAGVSMFAPIAALTEGHQYLISGAVQEFFEETEGTNNVYLRDEGPGAIQLPVVQTITVLRDTACDAGQAFLNGEDYEGQLVKVKNAKVVAFNNPPRDPGPGGDFYITTYPPPPPSPPGRDTILVSDQDASYTFDPDTTNIVNVTGILRFRFGFFRIYPRDNNDITLLTNDFTDVSDIPAELSFSVAPNPASAPIVSFALPRGKHVEIGVFDLAGRRLTTLVRGDFAAGSYSRKWDGNDASGNHVGAGMYFFRLNVGTETRIVRSIRLN